VEGVTYLPQLEQEQSEPQLQLEEPEHPHSPFMLMVLSDRWKNLSVFVLLLELMFLYSG